MRGNRVIAAVLGIALIGAAPVVRAEALPTGTEPALLTEVVEIAPPPSASVSTMAYELGAQAGALTRDALGWCVRGATITLAVTVAFAAPALASGAGIPIGASELAAAAGGGCVFGVAWSATSTSLRWAADRAGEAWSATPATMPPARGIAIAARD